MNPTRLLAGLLLASPLGALQAAPLPQSGPSETAPLWTVEERQAIDLLRSLRKKERPGDAELVARLAPGGARLLPLFFEVLEARAVPSPDAGDAQILSEVQEHVVLLALGELGRDAVLNHVAARVALSRETELRLAGVSAIGAVGRGNDFPALFELALEDEEKELERRMARAFRRAASAILARDPRAFDQLVQLRRITRPELLPTLVLAVGEARDPRGLAFLSEVVYWNESLTLDVMSQVPLLGLGSDAEVNEAMRVRLRRFLDESKPGHCRAAILALTALEDVDSIAALINLLGSETEGLRQNAHWALKTITGLGLSATQETWARWHQSELYWLVRQKPREFQRLRESDPAVAADALRAILTHPLASDELATALPDLLRARYPAVRILACNTLAQLDAKQAIGRLVWALEDRDPDVAKAAHAALKVLTLLDLPLDPLAWQAATNTEPRGTDL